MRGRCAPCLFPIKGLTISLSNQNQIKDETANNHPHSLINGSFIAKYICPKQYNKKIERAKEPIAEDMESDLLFGL
jgi:hypothetical protein